MAKKKPGLTIDQHKKLGKRLKKMQDDLQDISSIIGKAYGYSSRAGYLAENMARGLRSRGGMTPLKKLGCEMDTMVILETTRTEWDSKQYGHIYLG